MKMNQNDWEEVTQAHIAFYGNALIPEQSELNPTRVSLHMAERFAKKHFWEAAKPHLDQSI